MDKPVFVTAKTGNGGADWGYLGVFPNHSEDLRERVLRGFQRFWGIAL